jgi:hypothetical protein
MYDYYWPYQSNTVTLHYESAMIPLQLEDIWPFTRRILEFVPVTGGLGCGRTLTSMSSLASCVRRLTYRRD